MKRCFAAALGVLAIAAAVPVEAADLPRAAMPYKAPAYVNAYNWTGFYLGINGGGAWGDSSWNGLGIKNSPSGGMVGGTAGFNWQGVGSPWVFGIEGDVDWTDISDSVACAGFICQTKNGWLGTVRGRVGYAWDRFLPYFTGGAAFGDIKATVAPFAASNSSTNVGWTVGGGIEGVIVGNWTAKLEYLYVDLGNTNCGVFTCGTATNVDLTANVVRAGVNYRF